MNARIALGTRNLLLITLSVSLAAPSALAQKDTPQSSSNQTKTFDAVTIKPSVIGSHGRAWGFNGDTYTARNAPLVQVILQAYLDPSSPYRLNSAPAWVTDDLYDITAKLDGKTADAWKGFTYNQQMTAVAPLLRAMLTERFNLSLHTEATEIPGYALVVPKHGMKMRLVPPDEPEPKNANRMHGGGLALFTPPRADGKHVMSMVHTTMASLATLIGDTVVDRTDLLGKYDFELPRIVPDPADGSASAPPLDYPYQFDWAAIGLEIKPTKIPARAIVIDHIEKPSPN